MIHFLAVYLRGIPTPVRVPCSSAEFVRTTIAWFDSTYMRKCPQDRAGSWRVQREGVALDLNPDGVDARATADAVATFDPREVVAVVHHVLPSPPDLHPEDARNG